MAEAEMWSARGGGTAEGRGREDGRSRLQVGGIVVEGDERHRENGGEVVGRRRRGVG